MYPLFSETLQNRGLPMLALLGPAPLSPGLSGAELEQPPPQPGAEEEKQVVKIHGSEGDPGSLNFGLQDLKKALWVASKELVMSSCKVVDKGNLIQLLYIPLPWEWTKPLQEQP